MAEQRVSANEDAPSAVPELLDELKDKAIRHYMEGMMPVPTEPYAAEEDAAAVPAPAPAPDLGARVPRVQLELHQQVFTLVASWMGREFAAGSSGSRLITAMLARIAKFPSATIEWLFASAGELVRAHQITHPGQPVNIDTIMCTALAQLRELHSAQPGAAPLPLPSLHVGFIWHGLLVEWRVLGRCMAKGWVQVVGVLMESAPPSDEWPPVAQQIMFTALGRSCNILMLSQVDCSGDSRLIVQDLCTGVSAAMCRQPAHVTPGQAAQYLWHVVHCNTLLEPPLGHHPIEANGAALLAWSGCMPAAALAAPAAISCVTDHLRSHRQCLSPRQKSFMPKRPAVNDTMYGWLLSNKDHLPQSDFCPLSFWGQAVGTDWEGGSGKAGHAVYELVTYMLTPPGEYAHKRALTSGSQLSPLAAAHDIVDMLGNYYTNYGGLDDPSPVVATHTVRTLEPCVCSHGEALAAPQEQLAKLVAERIMLPQRPTQADAGTLRLLTLAGEAKYQSTVELSCYDDELVAEGWYAYSIRRYSCAAALAGRMLCKGLWSVKMSGAQVAGAAAAAAACPEVVSEGCLPDTPSAAVKAVGAYLRHCRVMERLTALGVAPFEQPGLLAKIAALPDQEQVQAQLLAGTWEVPDDWKYSKYSEWVMQDTALAVVQRWHWEAQQLAAAADAGGAHRILNASVRLQVLSCLLLGSMPHAPVVSNIALDVVAAALAACKAASRPVLRTELLCEVLLVYRTADVRYSGGSTTAAEREMGMQQVVDLLVILLAAGGVHVSTVRDHWPAAAQYLDLHVPGWDAAGAAKAGAAEAGTSKTRAAGKRGGGIVHGVLRAPATVLVGGLVLLVGAFLKRSRKG